MRNTLINKFVFEEKKLIIIKLHHSNIYAGGTLRWQSPYKILLQIDVHDTKYSDKSVDSCVDLDFCTLSDIST